MYVLLRILNTSAPQLRQPLMNTRIICSAEEPPPPPAFQLVQSLVSLPLGIPGIFPLLKDTTLGEYPGEDSRRPCIFIDVTYNVFSAGSPTDLGVPADAVDEEDCSGDNLSVQNHDPPWESEGET